MSSWTPPIRAFATPTPRFTQNQLPGQVAMSSIQPTQFNAGFNAMNWPTGAQNSNGFGTMITNSGNTMIDNREPEVNYWALAAMTVLPAVIPSIFQLIGNVFNRPQRQAQPQFAFAQMPVSAMPQTGAMPFQFMTASPGGSARFGQRQQMMFAPMEVQQQSFNRSEHLRNLNALRRENAELREQLALQQEAANDFTELFTQAIEDMTASLETGDRPHRASRHISRRPVNDRNDTPVSLSALDMSRPRSMRDFSLNANRFGVQQIDKFIGPDGEVIPLESDTTHNIISLQESQVEDETHPSLYITAGIDEKTEAFNESYMQIDNHFIYIKAGEIPMLWDAEAKNGEGAWTPFEVNKTNTTKNGVTYSYLLDKDASTENSGALQIEASNYEIYLRNKSVNHALSLSGRLLDEEPVAAGLVAETAQAGRQTADDMDLTRYQVDASKAKSLWSQRPSNLAMAEEADEDTEEETVRWADGGSHSEAELWTTGNVASGEDRPPSMAQASQQA